MLTAWLLAAKLHALQLHAFADRDEGRDDISAHHAPKPIASSTFSLCAKPRWPASAKSREPASANRRFMVESVNSSAHAAPQPFDVRAADGLLMNRCGDCTALT